MNRKGERTEGERRGRGEREGEERRVNTLISVVAIVVQ